MKVRKNYAQTTSKASTDHEEFDQGKIIASLAFGLPDCGVPVHEMFFHWVKSPLC